MIVLFDLDDTLLNLRDAADRAAVLFRQAYAERLTDEDEIFRQKWVEVSRKYMLMYSGGLMSFTDQRRQRIRAIFNDSRISDPEADRRFGVYLKHFENNWRLFDDALPCLASLGQHSLGIVTNGERVQQNQKIDRLGLRKYFDHVLISDEIGFSKPDARIYSAACRMFACTPGLCVFIGDNIENDVLGSQRAGMRPIWLNRFGQAQDGLDAEVIAGLDELKDKIERG